MVQISKRLQAVARLVTGKQTVADVGCDHGYIPVYLIASGKIEKAIAMDVKEGPLSRAKEHIIQYQMENKIELRLSDGVQALSKGEAESIVIAGMGGGLVQKILREGEQILCETRELVLQPQSEIQNVRTFLRTHGYQIVAEDMVEEDGKYYPMMRVWHSVEKQAAVSREKQKENKEKWKKICRQSEQDIQDMVDLYGPELLEKKHPVLRKYLQREAVQQKRIMTQLRQQADTFKIRNRIKQLTYEIKQNETAQNIIEV